MTKRELCLQLLREAGSAGVTTADFLREGCGSRFGARLHELERQGHRIESERIRDGSWRYILIEAGPRGVEGSTGAPHLPPSTFDDASSASPRHADSGALFAFPDAYEELRAKDVA